MFNSRVSRLDAFRSLMTKTCVNANGMDDSLFMTAFILLYNRVNNFKVTYTMFDNKEVDSISLNPEVYSFHWFRNITANPDEILKPVKNNFKSIEKLPTHEKFLSEKLKMPIWIRLMPSENTVCIFSETCSFQAWHGVQSFMPKFFNIFKEKPLTKEEISFLETLTFKTSLNYNQRLTELVNSSSFRSYMLKDQLEAFEKKLFEKKVSTAKENLSRIERAMEQAMENYRKACNERLEAMALVTGLKTMADQVDEHTELQDYLINNPRICNVALNDSRISFIAKTFLAPHHIEEYETISRKEEAFLQYTRTGFEDPKDIKLLMDAIFSSKRCLKLRLCAYFEMDYFGSQVNSISNYSYVSRDPELANYIPNPHLQHHNCFGQNKTAIVEQLKDGDAIGAIECAIACAQRIYIHDISYREFIQDLLRTTGKCLIAEDGTEMTPKEAVEYLKGKANA